MAERIALYAAILILALGLGYLVWTRQGGDCNLGPVVQALDGKLTALEQRLTDEVKIRIETSFSASNDDIKAALDGVNASLAETLDGKLAGLEGRVANSVYDRLRQAGICELTETECAPGAPPAMSVASNFTLLYENARLNKAREVTEASVGIRLEPRHRRRLELLANAFRACQRPDEPVAFHVTGYSSTAEFRLKKGTDAKLLSGSDELNLKTANLRAAVVGAYLKSKNLEFTVITKQWESYKDLLRPYLDDRQPGVDQQALNRTVFIEVRSAGACDLGQLSRPAS